MSEPSAARIEAARELIAKAKASGKFGASRPKTKQDEVRLLRDDIEGLRAEGATWTEVAAVLKPVLNVGPDTIRLAMGGGTKTATPSNSRTKLKRAANASKPKIERKKNERQIEPPGNKPEEVQNPLRPVSSIEHAATRRDGRKP